MFLQGGDSKPIVHRVLDFIHERFLPTQLIVLLERIRFRRSNGYWPDLFQPRSFNERICTKKFYERDPLLIKTSDKLAVREYITEILGASLSRRLLVPLFKVFESPEEVLLDKLPKRGVIKPSHSSGQCLIYSENDSLDQEMLFRLAEIWLSQKHGIRTNEWAYTNLKPRLLLEERLGNSDEIPTDYKCFVFYGRCKLIQVDQNRMCNHCRVLYDVNWNLLNIKYHKSLGNAESAPKDLGDMIALAEKLASPFDFARVDFYQLKDWIRIGEITHYPEAGYGSFHPRSFDFYLGWLWQDRQEKS